MDKEDKQGLMTKTSCLEDSMQLTKHLHQRANQRGVPIRLLEVADRFGMIDGKGRLVLDSSEAKKCLKCIRQEIQHMERLLLKVIDKGGVVFVIEGNSVLTTWRYGGRWSN